MIIGVTTDLIKLVSNLVRRADSGLASSAAENAARSMDAQHFRQLDDARTLRDLANIPAVQSAPARPIPALNR
jgi:hypothetical protein